MTTRRLGDICLLDSRLHRRLRDQFVDVMPPDDARPGILRRLRGREAILPHPLAIGIGVFALQRIRQVDVSSTRLQILFMEFLTLWRCRCKGALTCWGSIVTRSLWPLPSRTTI